MTDQKKQHGHTFGVIKLPIPDIQDAPRMTIGTGTTFAAKHTYRNSVLEQANATSFLVTQFLCKIKPQCNLSCTEPAKQNRFTLL
jgi:hypothetical protein